jgi:hypothetical protein
MIMICYTMSDCVLKNMNKEDTVIRDILMYFIIENRP